MDYGHLYQALIDSSAVLIVALVGIGVAHLRSYTIKNVASKELQSSILLTIDTIRDSVRSSVQQLSASGKAAVADGKIDDKELAKIQFEAINNFKTQVSPKLQKRLEAHVKDVQKYLLTKVSAELQKVDKVTG